MAAYDVGAQQDISGQWRLGARSDEGLPPFGMNSVVTLFQEGQSLTGTFRIGRGPTNSMTGSLVGANIRLQWNAGDPGDQTIVVFTGTVAERLMTGSVEVGSYTGGAWAAERMPGTGGGAVPDPAATDLPNPNPTVVMAWGQLPEGRAWGTSAGVDIGPDGHIWTYDRCGQTAFADVCSTSTVDPILKLDRMTGEVLASWGAEMFAFPHGIHVDRDGNVWITDSMANEAGTVGHQVIKFSPEGEILMTLGRAGVPETVRIPSTSRTTSSPLRTETSSSRMGTADISFPTHGTRPRVS